MEQSFFQILKTIHKDANLDPKIISDLYGISIGKVNHYIHQLTTEKYIYHERKGRIVSHFLTQKGLDFLQSRIENFHDKKVNNQPDQSIELKQAVILAAGSRKDFNKPAGLVSINGTSLLKRNIEILKENGFNHIVIITGYNREAFKELSNFSNLQFVDNQKYKWTGSMYSLTLAYEFITSDFILIEDDILIEERAIKEVIGHPQRDCVLITNENGSRDEAFVEIKNGYLHKISKDIHQFNKVDGEMVGISKLSYDVFSKMVSGFRQNNKNPLMNYEYMILDALKHDNIGYLKMHNLVWSELDSQQHYETIKNKIFPQLKRKEAEFREIQLKDYLIDALNITFDDIKEVQPFGGMTNKNFKLIVHDKEYVLRIPGNGTEQMINRKEEKVNLMHVSKMGIDTKLIYFNEETGVKVSELIQDAETLNSKTSKRQDYMELTTSILRKLHFSNVIMANHFNVFEKIEQYDRLMNEVNGQPYEYYDEVKLQVLKLQEVYQTMNIVLAPCHNDTVPENFVKSGVGKLYLIDWEYAGMNDPIWDVAAHSLECDFSPEDEELFLLLYLNKNEIPFDIRQRVLMNKIFQDFLWSIWTVIKEAKGDNFGTYGLNRFLRAKKNLNHSMIKGILTYEFQK
jgi:thiamine kinase-like enzyme/choline kinase/predicted transcriptional regulator